MTVKRIASADRRLDHAGIRLFQIPDSACLDILRAVAEGLVDRDGEAIRPDGIDPPGQTIAPTRFQLETKDPNVRARSEICGERIAKHWPSRDVERSRIGRAHETWATGDHRCPGALWLIDTADQNERQLGIKLAVLIRHVIADHLSGEGFDLVTDTETLLHLPLADVKG